MNTSRALTTFAVMGATIMQVLDITIINVSLPNMATALSGKHQPLPSVLTT